MMQCCSMCGAGDDKINMYYAHDKDGNVVLLCEGCAKSQKDITDVISVKDICNAIKNVKTEFSEDWA